eukprot:CAMPEP_0197073646 /NCGR_PEP_ID=MMETSP1384-20130603/210707_1 /TAXON_ID=29189 /ORGANISM="Ammonia sp." /LENGTH=870 /DNA_ID=CAMNT_0042512485 /DNA_START=84 /DNA_END=2698 /DNA_ORIENTATION=-
MAAAASESKSEPYNLLVDSVKAAVHDSILGGLELFIPTNKHGTWSVDSNFVVTVQTRRNQNASWNNNSIDLKYYYQNNNGVVTRQNCDGDGMANCSAPSITGNGGVLSCTATNNAGSAQTQTINLKTTWSLYNDGTVRLPNTSSQSPAYEFTAKQVAPIEDATDAVHASVENDIAIEPDVIPANQSQGWTVNSSFFVRLQTRVRSGNGWTPWNWQGVHLKYFYQNNNGVLVRQNCPNGDGMANCSAPSITNNGRFSCTAINNAGKNGSQSINCRTKWALDALGYVQVPSASSTQFAECADLVSPDLIQKAAVSATGADWVITVETRQTTSSPWLQNTLSLNAAYANINGFIRVAKMAICANRAAIHPSRQSTFCRVNINGFITRRQNGDMCQSSRDPSISSECILSCECRKNDGEWDQQQIHLLNVVSLDSEGSVIWPPPMHAVHSLLGPHEQLHGNSIYVLEFMIRGNLCRNWSVTASFNPWLDFLINVQTRKTTSSPWLNNALGLNAVYANLNGIAKYVELKAAYANINGFITRRQNGDMCQSSRDPSISSEYILSCECRTNNGEWQPQQIHLLNVVSLDSKGSIIWPPPMHAVHSLLGPHEQLHEDSIHALEFNIRGNLCQSWAVSTGSDPLFDFIISVQTRKNTNSPWLNNALGLNAVYANLNGIITQRNGGNMCLSSNNASINSSSGVFSCQCQQSNGYWNPQNINLKQVLQLNSDGYAVWPSGWSDVTELKEDYVSKKAVNVDGDAKEVEQFIPLDEAIVGSLEQNWSVSSSGVISVQTRKTKNDPWLDNSLNLSDGYANNNGVMVRQDNGGMCATSKDYAIKSSSGKFHCQCLKTNGKWKKNSMNMRTQLVLDSNGYATWPPS